jgi:predicted nucleic acid-binding protein
MRVLLDTNILIHREASTVVRRDIGQVFFWLDKLKNEKCIHPASLQEIGKHLDARVRQAFEAKLQSYHVLKTLAPMSPVVQQIGANDKTDNDRNDTLIVNELYSERVDFLISEDRGLHRKAQTLGVGDRAFTIDAYLEKVTAENPELADYKVLAVKRVPFGSVDVTAPFFDSFREDYGGAAFDKWFNRKADEAAYVCYEGADLVAFLYLKVEHPGENYSDIDPVFHPKTRLKIGTFKVDLNGYKLGERFLKIVFDNGVLQRAQEIYVTIFSRSIEQQRLINLLEDFGFQRHGTKRSRFGVEGVYVRSLARRFDESDPKRTFPYISKSSRSFIVPIYEQYHTSLLPDSILRTESPASFVEQMPHRNAIQKVYVSRSYFKGLKKGDTIVFYRTGGYHKGVVTTLGIVDDIHQRIRDEAQFISLCRKRSVFTDKELSEQWNYNPKNRPFIVGFLYAYSLPRRPNLKELIDNGVIGSIDSVPRGFEQISAEQLATVLALSKADTRFIVD